MSLTGEGVAPQLREWASMDSTYTAIQDSGDPAAGCGTPSQTWLEMAAPSSLTASQSSCRHLSDSVLVAVMCEWTVTCWRMRRAASAHKLTRLFVAPTALVAFAPNTPRRCSYASCTRASCIDCCSTIALYLSVLPPLLPAFDRPAVLLQRVRCVYVHFDFSLAPFTCHNILWAGADACGYMAHDCQPFTS